MTTQNCIPLEHEASEDHKTSVLNRKVHEESAEIIEEGSPVHNWKRSRLCIQIPSKDLGDQSVKINMPPTPGSTSTKADTCRTCTPTSTKKFMSPSPTSSKGKPSIKSLLPKLSFRSWSSTTESEKQTMEASEVSEAPKERPSALRSLSFTRSFMPRMGRTSSLPATSVAILHEN